MAERAETPQEQDLEAPPSQQHWDEALADRLGVSVERGVERLSSRRTFVLGLAGAAATAVLLTIGLANPWNLVLVDRAFAHPILGSWIILACLFVSFVLGQGTRWIRGIGVAIVIGLALILFPLSILFGIGSGGSTELAATSANGRVTASLQDVGSFDSAYVVTLRTDDGICSREQSFGLWGEVAPSVSIVGEGTLLLSQQTFDHVATGPSVERNEARILFDVDTLDLKGCTGAPDFCARAMR